MIFCGCGYNHNKEKNPLRCCVATCFWQVAVLVSCNYLSMYGGGLGFPRLAVSCLFNPSNAEATFVKNTKMQRLLKTILTLSCWYSLDSYRGALSDEYPFARVSVIFIGFFASFCIGQISHQQHKG